MASDRFILESIKAYRLPFSNKPHQNKKPSEPLLAVEEKRKTQRAIELLIEKNAVSLCDSTEEEFLSPYFLRQKTDGSFDLDSRKFCIRLPQKNKESTRELVRSFQAKSKSKIRELAQLIGTLVAACPAIKYGWLYTKRLKREKYLALKSSNGNFNSSVILSDKAKEDLRWWLDNIKHSSNPIREEIYTKEIFTDASLTGWGAFCEGHKVHGWMDNTTGISYVNRMGDIQHPKLTQLSRVIWQWCERRQIWVHASYLRSEENVEADEQSRVVPSEREWELADWVFQEIKKKFGPMAIDLFASRNNAKCQKFVSWHRDPYSVGVDSFTMNWIVVAPLWPTQPWYPTFISLMVTEPVIFRPDISLLTCPYRDTHPLWATLSLVAGRLSGRRSEQEEQQTKLQR
ncbi:uncharacterized protein LOC117176832 [Belonocnema kinseyi]|uniref:uncharacterized protein LOC117176832 n=1 Tax=Belonocnema kinseyi TaxID=2817044 RepID=UPI00143D7FCD|nr:uncharacterized protein LOC117176832 [Belonocnema kinseyi]